MKTKLATITVFLTGLFLATFAQAQGSLEGAWQVQEIMITGGDNEGTSTDTGLRFLLFSGGHYTRMGNAGTRPEFTQGEAPTDEQMIAAYNSFRANAGTYEVSGSKLMLHHMVARAPNAASGNPEFDYQVEGDKLMLTATNNQGVVTQATYTRLD